MISTSIRATWSRACCSVLAIAAMTASAATADLSRLDARSNRVALAGQVEVAPVAAALLPADADNYQVRVLYADGSPVTEQIILTSPEGALLQAVTPDVDGMISIVGQIGTKYGITLANSDTSTVGGGGLSGGIRIDVTPDQLIETVLFDTYPTSGGDIRSAGSLRGDFTSMVDFGQDGTVIDPGMVINVGGASCATAVALAIGGTDSGNTASGTPGLGGASTCNNVINWAGGGKVWYNVVGNGNRLTVETCAGPAVDTELWVFRQCGTGCSSSTLTCLGASDDACGPGNGFQSRVAWDSAAGVTYKVAVSGWGNANTAYQIACINGALSTAPSECPGACCVTSPPPYSQNEVPIACSSRGPTSCATLGGVFSGAGTVCTGIGGTVSFTEFDDTPVPPAPIPNFGGGSVTRTITVVPVGFVADVNVENDIQHPFNAELQVFIEKGATSVRIWNTVCGQPNIHHTIDGEGSNTLCAPISTGLLDNDGDGFNSDSPDTRPQDIFPVGSMFIEAFDFGSSNGVWSYRVIEVQNFSNAAAGIQHWGLELTAGTTILTACADVDCSGSGCADPSGRTLICHIPPGNPDNRHEITVGNAAVPTHLAQHGDNCGPCTP